VNADRLTSLWVAGYTRGLPQHVREARANEITSDLWEHRQEARDGVRTELAIVSRALRGTWADLSWRRAQRRGLRLRIGARPILHFVGWAMAAVSYAFIVGLHSWGATRLIGLELYGEDWAPGDVQVYSRICAVLLCLLVGGAMLIPRLPVLGAMLVTLGLVAQLVIFWWAIPILLPSGTAIAVAALVIARRCERGRQLRASSAAS
jgi:hypothetical protein